MLLQTFLQGFDHFLIIFGVDQHTNLLVVGETILLIMAFYDFVVDLFGRIVMIKILDPVENGIKNGGELEVFEPLPLQTCGWQQI